MIRLVKKNKQGEKQLIAKDADFTTDPAGVVINFKATDNRKPSYFVLLEEQEVVALRNTCARALDYIESRRYNTTEGITNGEG